MMRGEVGAGGRHLGPTIMSQKEGNQHQKKLGKNLSWKRGKNEKRGAGEVGSNGH